MMGKGKEPVSEEDLDLEIGINYYRNAVKMRISFLK